ncbi:sensor histidine kinase [Pseudoroseicyclus sp. CLL3-39]|uniref:C4-dicarboxylate transport sensor protein DctB n=2 Tax=Pseudoroseicyclus tamaricis TaxID=2705421 RepID=A0A6B2JSR9_9RHOB|nr:ATP-binding protein [Pseudoroseicyclus tamaricis]NDV01050.1 sensor histidine kinase [Pseudoroseicyclus tamaricis]
MQVLLLAFTVTVIAVLWLTNSLLTERFTETTRNRAEVRAALYAGSLVSELQRNSIVPQLLARDPELIAALNTGDYTLSSQRLLSYLEESGAAGLTLFDSEGRVVAATNRERLGETHRNAPLFVDAIRNNVTMFSLEETESGAFRFVYSRRIDQGGTLLGVIAVEANLSTLERSWVGTQDAVIVLDSEERIILSTEPRWRGLEEGAALATQSVPSAIERALRLTQDWTVLPPDAYVGGEAVLRRELRVPFQGWRLVTFTTYASVRERVNGVLALEIMGFAILLAGGFWVSSRKSMSRMVFFQRESAELRELNRRLQREMAERQRAEENLQVAEQTLAQSSKLAVLGEMSASVSHELNQPLAAMKTYLAGARLLLERKRPEEALASFHRIDDLIDRMGAITRQLKSYARKGADAFAPMDVRAAVSSALAMMEPQLKNKKVKITRTLPSTPVMVTGDRLRLEQVIVNLLRNAIDATKEVREPSIDITLAAGDSIRLTVRDNGHGIENMEALFEPFYTTKQPGDGVGLGLAISSGIVSELGGRLTARNSPLGGAVFEVELPSGERRVEAAE